VVIQQLDDSPQTAWPNLRISVDEDEDVAGGRVTQQMAGSNLSDPASG
jgi:hypothetical protein